MTNPTRPLGEVHRVPRTYNLPTQLHAVVERYRKLRLHGLKVDPHAFSSTYERESQFEQDKWIARIENPAGKTFVSVIPCKEPVLTRENEIIIASDSSGALGSLLRNEWTGQLTLIGPEVLAIQGDETAETGLAKPWSVFFQDEQCIPPLTPTETMDLRGAHLVYMVVGMFVSPESRRGGHGQRLIEAAVQAAREEGQTRGAASVRIVLIVEPENHGAQKLYERTGFALWDDTVLERNSGKLSRVLAMVREVVM
ncbi:hypothetical protein N7474_000439 [Penicillium riverlandense]|uniref:uncharacterized protein n=1 Tax=Penicillium riverlandense TaxID=1903569 RepID=UPI0025483376|nr:uncharacterized protein N7474_000439 [Penicillium riverlandense]KAJ5832128.1 hypothetical protein N7474_000439 [Penicillium riverlandense]